MGPQDEIIQRILALSAVIMGIAVIAFIITIIVYILKAIALTKLCEVYGIKEKWLSWVPIGNYYVILKIGERGVSYIFIPILQFILYLVTYTTDSPGVVIISSILILCCVISWMVIQIQAFQMIGKKLDMNSGWLVAGVFFNILHVVAWSLVIKRTYYLDNNGYFVNVKDDMYNGL